MRLDGWDYLTQDRRHLHIPLNYQKLSRSFFLFSVFEEVKQRERRFLRIITIILVMTMGFNGARSLSSLIILLVVFAVYFPPAVRSSVIRLPSDAVDGESDGGICGGSEVGASCPVQCFRPDPVCGVDGVTYWCGCAEARCAGMAVAQLGICEVGNGSAGQALLLVHIVWLMVLGFFVLFGLV